MIMIRRNLCRLLIVSLIVVCLCPGLTTAEAGQGWRVFKGAWFEIKYPPGFTVKPGQRSRTSVRGYDSAFFISPDQKVEFYVFSPQWNGTPDYSLDSVNEVIVSNDVTTKNNVTVTQVTIKEKNGGYLRSWLDKEDKLSNTRCVFGIKYRNKTSYDQYRPDYLIFKNSLRQFAD
jgi:hypothetical protein